MPKSNKIKNPCKICLGPVTQKNGLQCQGACETWLHYECLNFTPGKIKDIKAGVIKISCPCPDCKTSLPKEYRIDEPFSCSNAKCPANITPKCGNVQCPTAGKINNKEPLPAAAGSALDKSGKSCKENINSRSPRLSQPQPIQPCAPLSYPLPVSSSESTVACRYHKACASGCSSSRDVPGDFNHLKHKKNNNEMPSIGTLENMCNTVGQLTEQINKLMYKMKDVVQEKQAQKSCQQSGPRSLCPKPCYCPGNPGRKQ